MARRQSGDAIRFVTTQFTLLVNLARGSADEINPHWGLIVAWDPTEPVATRPLVLQRQGGWNFFYTHDGNKNVSDVVSFQQARGVPAHYEYAPFRAVTAATTNTAFTAFNVAEANPFRFSSEYSDDTLGLVYYNYRHYNPMDGRWLRRDPKEPMQTLLAFVANECLGKTDRLGLEFLIEHHKPAEVPEKGWSTKESTAETIMNKSIDTFILRQEKACEVCDECNQKLDARGSHGH